MIHKTGHGIARYVSDLILGLDRVRETSSLPYEIHLLTSPAGEHFHGGHGFETTVAHAAFLSPGELVEIPRLLKRLQARLYHSPSFSSLWSCPCPHVQTVFDLNHLHFGSSLQKLYYRALLKPFARRARPLLTVSEFSRQEIARWMGIPTGRIEVVPCALDTTPEGLSGPETQAILDPLGLKAGNYFLAIGNSKPHKNLPFLMECYREYRSHTGQHHPRSLVMNIGSPGLAAEGVKTLGAVSEPVLRALYSGAAGFFAPSLYEGFSLAPLEALLHNLPVAVSDIPAHREGFGARTEPALRFLDPESRESWTQAFKEMDTLSPASPSIELKNWIRQTYTRQELARAMDRCYRSALHL
jgi:glycosyltransferase involved in cell wall biosynthesis